MLRVMAENITDLSEGENSPKPYAAAKVFIISLIYGINRFSSQYHITVYNNNMFIVM